tara:strand:- start:387 stop:1160 length:774 start_codon:yes stop_codon:yes gene_type:complete
MEYNNLHDNTIFSISNLLTIEECNKIIQKCNDKGWNKSSPSGGGHGRTGTEDPRTNSFCVFFDDNLADKLWMKIKPNLKEDLSYLGENVYFHSIDKGKEWKPSFVFNKMRVYKYNPGEAFPEHIDYKVKRNIIKNEKGYIQQSFLTLLIYLNDDFDGGETGYWPDHNGIHCRFLRNVEKQSCVKDHQVLIQPTTGLAVVQDQNILHEGLPTTKGIKYLLRTDIIHEREVKENQKVKIEFKESDWERLFETSCKNYAD